MSVVDGVRSGRSVIIWVPWAVWQEFCHMGTVDGVRSGRSVVI